MEVYDKDPFQRLNALLVQHNLDKLRKEDILELHIGVPKGDAHVKVTDMVRETTKWNAYHPLQTHPTLIEAIQYYNNQTHNVNLSSDQISAVQ